MQENPRSEHIQFTKHIMETTLRENIFSQNKTIGAVWVVTNDVMPQWKNPDFRSCCKCFFYIKFLFYGNGERITNKLNLVDG